MQKEIKKKIAIISVLSVIYIFYNYLPIQTWFDGEWTYTIFRLVSLLFFAISCLIVKKVAKIELEIPLHQISHIWLIPLLIPCFSNFFYVLLMNIKPAAELNYGMLAVDLISDFFLSVVEDLIFVDMLNSFFLNLFEGRVRKAKLLSMALCALIFTIIHCYSFLNLSLGDAAFELLFILLITFECSYLAIYFDSEWIPIVFHFFFNAVDFVTFQAIYDVNMSWNYAIFSILIVAFTLFYILALTKISSLQKYKKIVYKDEDK